ncbi:MAG: glycosyltransferase [Planctomycetota bacterium]
MSPPPVSIIVPLYESATTIDATLRSVRAQSLTAWEAIVVNDGSTDGGTAIAQRHAEEDDRIRLIHQENAGLARARNVGIDASRGAYVHFLDADDLLEPEGLAALLAAAADTGASAGRARYIDAAGTDIGWVPEVPPGQRTLRHLAHGNCICVPSQLLHRDVLGDDRFDDTLSAAADYDLWARLALRGITWTSIETIVCAYRLRMAGMSRAHVRMMDDIAIVLNRLYGGDARSDVRGHGVLARHALEHATALAARGKAPEADALLRAHEAARTKLSPTTAGRVAHAALAYEFCRSPESYWSGDVTSAVALLDTWWSRCERTGAADPGFVRGARRVLAMIIARGGCSPEDLLAQINTARRPVLLGLGRNGARIARALHARGHHVAARDDGLDAAQVRQMLGDAIAEWLPADAPYSADRQHVMTLEDDASWMARLPAGLDVVRFASLWEGAIDATERRLYAHLGDETMEMMSSGRGASSVSG